MLSVRSAALVGINAVPVTVETDIAPGLPKFTIVGLPDAAVQESKERVRAALKNSGFVFPRTRLTVNLAPADVRKEGPRYDLPIAVSILLATGIVPPESPVLADSFFVGELALDGSLRPVTGVLPIALLARETGARTIFVPPENAGEAALVSGITVVPIRHLNGLISICAGTEPISPYTPTATAAPPTEYEVDFSHVHGQQSAKRALEIAAAGGHNVLMTGPPGAGKTLLAHALPSILPPLTPEETIEVTRVWSVAGLLASHGQAVTARPFRSPHHSASAIALVGGGPSAQPGEVSLAHHGVLFLDEFPEFKRHVIEHLRQPLEHGTIHIARASAHASYPARFMLVAAQNPCPCGFSNDPTRACQCSPHQLIAYQKKISGPLHDRIDITLTVPAVPFDELMNDTVREPSAVIRERIIVARGRQHARSGGVDALTNAALTARSIKLCCVPTEPATALLKTAIQKYRLSARSYHRVLKLARTIADLDGAEKIEPAHVAEALQYRPAIG